MIGPSTPQFHTDPLISTHYFCMRGVLKWVFSLELRDVLNWGVFSVELRGVWNWGVVRVELRGLWIWGVCGSEGFFGVEPRGVLNWGVFGVELGDFEGWKIVALLCGTDVFNWGGPDWPWYLILYQLPFENNFDKITSIWMFPNLVQKREDQRPCHGGHCSIFVAKTSIKVQSTRKYLQRNSWNRTFDMGPIKSADVFYNRRTKITQVSLKWGGIKAEPWVPGLIRLTFSGSG